MIRINRLEQIIRCAASLIMIMHSTMSSVSTGGRDGIASQIVILPFCLNRLNVNE